MYVADASFTPSLADNVPERLAASPTPLFQHHRRRARRFPPHPSTFNNVLDTHYYLDFFSPTLNGNLHRVHHLPHRHSHALVVHYYEPGRIEADVPQYNRHLHLRTNRTALIAGATAAAVILAFGAVFIYNRTQKRRIGFTETIKRIRGEAKLRMPSDCPGSTEYSRVNTLLDAASPLPSCEPSKYSIASLVRVTIPTHQYHNIGGYLCDGFLSVGTWVRLSLMMSRLLRREIVEPGTEQAMASSFVSLAEEQEQTKKMAAGAQHGPLMSDDT
ncbi:hypothetical protein IW262DRAFT_1468712 [Armillaria fumosa]|nr:hypothetical protein IW262DRAFT_1468712 [Armillaria fumosa]